MLDSGRCKIVIILEAGYKELHGRYDITDDIKIADNLYFSPPCLSYPGGNPLNKERVFVKDWD